jgi:hypothetical protein
MVASPLRKAAMKPRTRTTIAIAFALCAAVAAAHGSAPVGSGQTVVAASVLPDLARAQAIAIDDVWNGFSRLAPIEAHYVLQRAANGFRGSADFSAGGGYPGGPTHAQAQLTLPPAAASAFFATLAKTPLHGGEYTPKRRRTDDYPDMTITITIDGKDVIFSSQSQGEERAPWLVHSGDADYVSDSGLPAAALAHLAPYLKRDVLDAIVEKLKR